MAFNLVSKEIYLAGKTYPITKWEVWFQTPWGMYADLDDAKKKAIENDVDPAAVIIPVPVAIGPEPWIYESIARL